MRYTSAGTVILPQYKVTYKSIANSKPHLKSAYHDISFSDCIGSNSSFHDKVLPLLETASEIRVRLNEALQDLILREKTKAFQCFESIKHRMQMLP